MTSNNFILFFLHTTHVRKRQAHTQKITQACYKKIKEGANYRYQHVFKYRPVFQVPTRQVLFLFPLQCTNFQKRNQARKFIQHPFFIAPLQLLRKYLACLLAKFSPPKLTEQNQIFLIYLLTEYNHIFLVYLLTSSKKLSKKKSKEQKREEEASQYTYTQTIIKEGQK